MLVLVDTNILIHREDYEIIPENLQNLLKTLHDFNVKILVHPRSIEEINGDQNERRRTIKLSKIKTYTQLKSPPNPNANPDFLNVVGWPSTSNEAVDSALLYAVYKDAVDFLLTEDKEIRKKASKLDIKDRVISIEEGLETFKLDTNQALSHPPALKSEFVYNLDIKDPFFNSLKEDYPEFPKWFKKISLQHRKCWVYFNKEGTMGALLIYKTESEDTIDLGSQQPLPPKKRLKISTLKVSHVGYKIGELFIKLSVEYSMISDLSEIYLTHFTKESDLLVDLITEFGFKKVGVNKYGEEVFLKELLPAREELRSIQPLEVSKEYWPNFYDGRSVNKFIIPIRPKYHDRLFIEGDRQTLLMEHSSEFITEGNTIKKAYLSHSRISKISPGDILLFYLSIDKKEITALCVVERAIQVSHKDEIVKLVGKRTVYTIPEIDEIAKKPTMVILFSWHFQLPRYLKLNELKKMGVLKAAPQSIVQISHEKYLNIKVESGIDERFTVN